MLEHLTAIRHGIRPRIKANFGVIFENNTLSSYSPKFGIYHIIISNSIIHSCILWRTVWNLSRNLSPFEKLTIYHEIMFFFE